MRRVLVVCALAAMPIMASGELPVLRLYADFQQEPPEAVRQAIGAELDNILSTVGISVEWRTLRHHPSSEVAPIVAVIRFKGLCDASIEPLHTRSAVLGITHTTDGGVIPFSDINCESIRSYLYHDLKSVRQPDRQRAFGQAVARVLAHELYHILAKTMQHGSSGLAKADFTKKELLSRSFRFNGRDSDLLRSETTHLISGGTLDRLSSGTPVAFAPLR
jgi:hypothetical protein